MFVHGHSANIKSGLSFQLRKSGKNPQFFASDRTKKRSELQIRFYLGYLHDVDKPILPEPVPETA